jgi:O-antigen/teichoic acid export membrane protein/CelD/BcsL family acetyltransferase involved in cellulose biosynthesis
MSDAAPEASVARGSAVLSSAFLVVGAGNYVFSVALAYALSPAGYGVVALVQGFLLFAAWFTSAGFPWTVARRLSQTRDLPARAAALRGALLGNLVVASLLGAVLLVLLATGTLRLGSESAAPLLLAALACSIAGVNAAAKGGLQGLFRFGAVAAVNIVEIVVKLGVGLGLGFAGLGPTGAALGILAGLIVATLFSLVALRDLPLRHTRGFGGAEMLRETMPLFAGTAGMALLTSLDLFGVKVLTPADTSNQLTALYQAAVTLGRIPYFFASALTTAVFPYIARHSADRVAGGLYVRKGVLFIVALLAPISLVFVAAPEAALHALYPARYGDAADALRLTAAGTTFLALATFLVGSLQAVGRDRLSAAVVGGAVALELVGLGIGVPAGVRHGGNAPLLAAGASFLAVTVLAVVVLYAVSWRTFAWRPRLHGVFAFAVAALAYVLVLRAIPHSSRLGLAVAVVVAGAVYAFLAVALGLLSPGDLRALRSGVPGLAPALPPHEVEVQGASGLTAICHDGARAFDAATPAWTTLLSTQPFLRPAWLCAWWQVYGRGREARIVEIRAHHRPVGLAFLQVTTTPVLGTRRLGFIGGAPGNRAIWAANPRGLGAAYFNDLLTAPGEEAVAAHGLRAWLEASTSDWDVARLTVVPEDSPLADLAASPPAGLRGRSTSEQRWVIDTSVGWEAYYASCSKRQRRHLRYEPRHLAAAAGGPLEDEWVRGAAAVDAMEEFIDLHARRWAAERKPGLQSGEGALYRALAAAHPEELVVVRLHGNGRVLAMQWGFDDGRRYVPYNFAFDPAFHRQSPNNVLLGLVVRRCCDDGHTEVDLVGFGSAEHWTEQTRARLVLTLASTRPGSRVRAGLLDAAEAMVAGSQRTAAGRTLRRAIAAAVALAPMHRGRTRSHGRQ